MSLYTFKEWITEEDMYPTKRITEEYEDCNELELFDYWEDYQQENKYEGKDK